MEGLEHFLFHKTFAQALRALMSPHVVGTYLKGTLWDTEGLLPSAEALEPRPLSLGQAPFPSIVGPKPMSDCVGVYFPSGCSGSAGPPGLSVNYFSPPGSGAWCLFRS